MSSVLITGGAGYIGSFMVNHLLQLGAQVTIYDNLERGNEDRIPVSATLVKGSLLDKELLISTFQKGNFDSVIHFAGYISVAESTKHLGDYFENNVQASVNVLEAMVESAVSSIVFSSSAAVYGNPLSVPIPEDHQKHPESPYGESKLIVERILAWYHKLHAINSVSLRYFNASGAALDGSMGESHKPETHMIPCAILALLEDKPFKLYGTDYDTPDGTCVRDYVHVLDLVQAHVLALKKIESDSGAYAYNVGAGKGYSNQEVINMIEKVGGKILSIEKGERRAGDPSQLIADSSKIASELGFTPEHSDLETIISSAWKWHSR